MKNSLKVFTLSLLIIMMALFLTSCIDVKLDYELNDKSLVVLYTLSIDSTDCKWQQDETQLKTFKIFSRLLGRSRVYYFNRFF